MGRRSAAIVLGVGLLLVLSACGALLENQAKGPLSLAVIDGQPRVVTCEQADVALVSISERPNGDDWNEFWDVKIAVELKAGDEVVAAIRDSNAKAPPTWPSLDPGDFFLVILGGKEGSTDLPPQAGFAVPEDGMPDDGWLHPDGSITSEPCPPEN